MKPTKTITANLDQILEMVLGRIADVDDATLVAAAGVVLGHVREVASEHVEDGEAVDAAFDVRIVPFRPLPIETLFTAFQAFLLDTQRAGFDHAERAAARDRFQAACGPLANLIDWRDTTA